MVKIFGRSSGSLPTKYARKVQIRTDPGCSKLYALCFLFSFKTEIDKYGEMIPSMREELPWALCFRKEAKFCFFRCLRKSYFCGLVLGPLWRLWGPSKNPVAVCQRGPRFRVYFATTKR